MNANNRGGRLSKFIGAIRKIAMRRRAERRAKAEWSKPALPWQPRIRPAYAR
jgi:hypothetical protein